MGSLASRHHYAPLPNDDQSADELDQPPQAALPAPAGHKFGAQSVRHVVRPSAAEIAARRSTLFCQLTKPCSAPLHVFSTLVQHKRAAAAAAPHDF